MIITLMMLVCHGMVCGLSACVCPCVFMHMDVCVYISFPNSEPTVWDAFQLRNDHLLAKLRARKSCTFR